jgi:1,5-anhydro-D-fructose reductase (1,5-anhydro-D-mannitol-forming)
MVNFGIVGFGLHAVKRLMPGFHRASNCRVVALSRREMEKARSSAREHDIPLAFDSAQELCESPEVDVVFVATPNAFHLQDVLTAVRAGKPVLCEKPMGVNADQCRQMIDAAKAANVVLGVAQVFRFEESTTRLQERLAAGQIGKPVFARSEFCFPGGTGHPRTWLNNLAVSGGGPIADVGVHCIDAMRMILQDEVVRVTARGFSDDLSNEVEAGATLVLEFSRGTLGNISVSFRSEYRTPCEVVGETGSLRADDAFNVEHPLEIQLRRGGKIVESETVSNLLAYAKQVDGFADAVEGNAKFPVPGEEGLRNQLVIDAAYESMKSGCAVPIK